MWHGSAPSCLAGERSRNGLFQTRSRGHAFRSMWRRFRSRCRPICSSAGAFCSIPAFHGTSNRRLRRPVTSPPGRQSAPDFNGLRPAVGCGGRPCRCAAGRREGPQEFAARATAKIYPARRHRGARGAIRAGRGQILHSLEPAAGRPTRASAARSVDAMSTDRSAPARSKPSFVEPVWNRLGTGLEPVWNRFGTGLEPGRRRVNPLERHQDSTERADCGLRQSRNGIIARHRRTSSPSRARCHKPSPRRADSRR